jgi:hypothetical protein
MGVPDPACPSLTVTLLRDSCLGQATANRNKRGVTDNAWPERLAKGRRISMDRPKKQKRWQCMVGLAMAIVCGLVASSSAATSCAQVSLPRLLLVPFTPSTSIRQDFLDNNVKKSSWKLIARARNNGTSNVSYQLTVTLAGNTCSAGPASLGPGAIGTKNCTIQPEYTPTGRYTMIVTASGASSLQWQYEICQNP